MQFSPSIIHEYQQEMIATYGVLVSPEDSQIQLYSLVRCVFGDVGGGAGAGTLVRHRATLEVGDSITPTSGHLDK
ncbi:hypothetical protein BH11PAT2_BH11PAT2_00550 [soil metagenome]